MKAKLPVESLILPFSVFVIVLTWALYFLATHQDVQEKLHEEILTVLGDDDDVDISHIAQLV